MPFLLPSAIAASSILWYSKVTCSISAIVNLERITDDTGIVLFVDVDDNLAFLALQRRDPWVYSRDVEVEVPARVRCFGCDGDAAEV